MAARRSTPPKGQTTDYKHSQEAVQRPDVGVQDQFSAKKPPKTYRYDSSLDPALSWDESRDRELAEWLLGLVQRCATEGEAAVFKEPQVWAGGRRTGPVAEGSGRPAAQPDQAIPELVRQGRAPPDLRADRSAVRARAALDQGDP